MAIYACDPADLFESSRVTALRWDIIPWSLVLDLNAELTEEANAPLHRGWVVFRGVSDVYVPFDDSRLPLGFWVFGYGEEQVENCIVSSMYAQICKFDDDAQIVDPQLKQLRIRSKDVTAIVSEKSTTPDEYRNIDHLTRQGLGSDSEFLQFLQQAQ